MSRRKKSISHGLGGYGSFSFLRKEIELSISNVDPLFLKVQMIKPIKKVMTISLADKSAADDFKNLMLSAWEQTDQSKFYHDYRPIETIKSTHNRGYLERNSWYYQQDKFIKEIVRPLFKTYIDEYRVVTSRTTAVEIARMRIQTLQKLIA